MLMGQRNLFFHRKCALSTHSAQCCACLMLVMRTSGVAFAFLALRSRLAERFTRSNYVCGALQATGATGLSDVDSRRILILDPASSSCFHELESAGCQVTPAHGMSDAELEQVLPGYDAVVVRSANRITRSMLVASPRVAVVGRAGSGVDNIDLDSAFDLGVPVVNAPTGNAGSVAELVLGLMLGVSRSMTPAHETMRRGEWAKKSFSGRTLRGKTLGIVGFGSVGREVARLAVAFGMVVMIAKETKPPTPGKGHETDAATSKRAQVAGEIGVTGPPLHLDELLLKSDYVSLHVPLTAGTKGMIAERELALMKPSAVIVNTARGGLLDERALLRALEDARLGGAALDAFDSEKAPLEDHVINLCRLPNVICMPHIGGSTEEAGELVLAQVCCAVVAALDGTLPPSRIVNGSPDTNLRLARVQNGRP